MSHQTNINEIHEGERNPILKTIGDQARELYEQAETIVTCPCGESGALREMFRCLYCEVIFCPSCADDHFGESQ